MCLLFHNSIKSNRTSSGLLVMKLPLTGLLFEAPLNSGLRHFRESVFWKKVAGI